MTTIESNQMRRVHRVTIPLTIIINKKAYRAKDWSMTGAGVEDFNFELKFDEVIDASII